MTFDEVIKHCDGLFFMKRLKLPTLNPGNEFYNDPFLKLLESNDQAFYCFVPEECFYILFYRGMAPFFVKVITDKLYESCYHALSSAYYFRDNRLTFEEGFERLSTNCQENILYNLDLFTRIGW